MLNSFVYAISCFFKEYWRTYENKLEKAYENCHKLFLQVLPNRLPKLMPSDKLKYKPIQTGP